MLEFALTQLDTLLAAFQRGERLTVAIALERYGIYALSQRVGELKRAGIEVQSRMLTLPSGKKVSEYWKDYPEGRLRLPSGATMVIIGTRA